MKFDFFLKRELRKALIQKREPIAFKGLDSINSVLILFNKEDWNDVKGILSDLKKEKKNVSAWSVEAHPTQNENDINKTEVYSSDVRFINMKTEVTWKKTLKPDIVDEFKKLDYDTCIDLTSTPNLYLLFLLANNKNQFSIGVKESEYKLYDFIILKTEDSNLLDTYKQIKYYLAKVK